MVKFTVYGIDDNSVKQVQSKEVEGAMAMFLLNSNTVVQLVADKMKKLAPF